MAAGLFGGLCAEYFNVWIKSETNGTFYGLGPGNKFRIGHLGAGAWEVTASGQVGENQWAYMNEPVAVVLSPGQRQVAQLDVQVGQK
ncbi:MAG: hypothetical protein NTZ09_10495 [Candidatus Hydrogenedentes bacterium]|nr:hypothetical protein [Candidatus Hydrogenedentota bacterium]